jgi:hypothetical protein
MQPADVSKILNTVISKEPEAIIRTLAMMTYNPAIGRVLNNCKKSSIIITSQGGRHEKIQRNQIEEQCHKDYREQG